MATYKMISDEELSKLLINAGLEELNTPETKQKLKMVLEAYWFRGYLVGKEEK